MPKETDCWNIFQFGNCDREEVKSEDYCTDYHNRCGHCHEYIGEDRYCRYCGTKRGQGEYKPYLDVIQCIYGPMPIKRTHECSKCGNVYTVALMVDNENYCPLCGGETFVTEPEWSDSCDDDTSAIEPGRDENEWVIW